MYGFLVMSTDLAGERGNIGVVKGRKIGAVPHGLRWAYASFLLLPEWMPNATAFRSCQFLTQVGQC